MNEIINAKGNDLKKYLKEVVLAEKEQAEFIRKAKKVVERYRDEDRSKTSEDLPARYNILWSNTETMGPALYNRTPKVEVDRRFKDADPVGRTACQIWERAVQFSIDNYDFDSVMKAVIKDYQLASRGTAWLRYEPFISNGAVSYQQVSCDHVHFTDFFHSPGKQWAHVRGVGRKVYLNRRQLIERFGKKIGGTIGLDFNGVDSTEDTKRMTSDQEEYRQAKIYEWWDAETMRVVWLSKSYPDNVLDMIDDPLGLHNFFPTPKPLFGTWSTDTLIPIPDYCLYQDQARELDQITIKIALLTDALRLVGVYDASFEKLGGILGNSSQNTLIPIHNYPKFAAQGGFEGVMQWMTLSDIVGALQAAYIARDKIKEEIDEITGIADIIRGSTSPTATTATEQQIKGQFATLRISDRQRDVERYACDLISLQGEIIAEHFEPQTLAMMSGYDISTPQVQEEFMPAVALLRADPMRSFRITIETDSMVAVDEAMDKQKTTEFLQTVGGFLSSAMDAIGKAPVLAPMMSEMLLFATRRYRAGRGLETAIETAGQALVQMAQQQMSQPPAPDPAMAKIQGDLRLEQVKSQNDFQLKQAELAQKEKMATEDAQQKLIIHQKEMEGRMYLAQQESEASIAISQRKMEQELLISREKAAQEMQIEAAKLQQKSEIETKNAILKSGLPDLHITPSGAMTTKPPMIKEGEFFHDPVTGNRKVRIVEKPLEEGAEA